MRRVFSRFSYCALAISIATVSFLVLAFVESIPLLWLVCTDASLSGPKTLELLSLIVQGALVDIQLGNLVYIVSLSILLGINTALLLFYFRMFRAAPSSVDMASGGVGIISAVLGFGCGACGSIFITAFIASVGGAGLLAFLPYGGLEIGFLGIALLAFSTLHLSRNINKPRVCPI